MSDDQNLNEDFDEMEAPGWDAIEAALENLYGDQVPKHYGTVIPYNLGGPDPLNGISAYVVKEPLPHWHFVTYGFSELYEKETSDPNYSGYGFELTFRLAKSAAEEEPPAWALNLLQNMGRYIFSSGNVFRSGDYMDANGPICLGADTKLTALAFITDPQLPEMDTPNGKVEFLQMIGITLDELEAMQVWNTFGVLSAASEHLPLYLTDLTRDSLLKLPSVSTAVQQGSETEGSNTAFLFVDQLAWEPASDSPAEQPGPTLQLGAKQAEIVGKLLRGRITKGRNLSLVSSGIRVVFEPGERAEIAESENEIILRLDQQTVSELTPRFRPAAGTFAVPSLNGISFRIVRTNIKDSEGNIVHTIG
ncbi:hypothetical protein GCM10010912_10360 [Paenibacillus albidus]|uniref:Suppressor of fused-like domain-containing protein n=1 Tax=Paenibacillus albidus TaxID=2041023 RepID=A0A917C1F5_9BACL|nr:suppressor of fused domain protein [Paenibacillus albidus]GGF67323.1 hypothetical protein GCM10010912_10360 [Paenibacillus albidus]